MVARTRLHIMLYVQLVLLFFMEFQNFEKMSFPIDGQPQSVCEWTGAPFVQHCIVTNLQYCTKVSGLFMLTVLRLCLCIVPYLNAITRSSKQKFGSHASPLRNKIKPPF